MKILPSGGIWAKILGAISGHPSVGKGEYFLNTYMKYYTIPKTDSFYRISALSSCCPSTTFTKAL